MSNRLPRVFQWRLLASVTWLGLAVVAQADTAAAIDRIVIEKAAHRLTVFSHGAPMKSYSVALGGSPVGPKERKGDARTPEGLYTIDARKADSAFHRALHVSYPNAQDKARAAALGVDAGGDVMIHGIRNGLGWLGPLHRVMDWTKGCVALTDSEMDELWSEVPVGTAVEIKP